MANVTNSSFDSDLDSAEQLIFANDLVGAKKIILRVLNKDPQNIRAYFYIGDVDQANRSKAISRVDQLTPRDSREKNFKRLSLERRHLDNVDNLINHDESEQAKDILEKVLQVVPDSIRGLYYKSALSQTTEEQSKLLRKTQTLKPRTPEEKNFQKQAADRLIRIPEKGIMNQTA